MGKREEWAANKRSGSQSRLPTSDPDPAVPSAARIHETRQLVRFDF